jgi:hypothetical protein
MHSIIKLTTVALAIILTACGIFATRRHSDWATLEDWDTDQSLTLDETEFTTGYLNAECFSRWNKKGKPLPIEGFIARMFHCLDVNNNNQIDSAEFVVRQRKYLLKNEDFRFDAWNSTRGPGIGYDEFARNIIANHVVDNFDLSKDHLVTAPELAQAMFRIADQDGDNKLGSMEFYLWEIHRCPAEEP